MTDDFLKQLHDLYPDDSDKSNYEHITLRLADIYYVDKEKAEEIHKKYHKK